MGSGNFLNHLYSLEFERKEVSLMLIHTLMCDWPAPFPISTMADEGTRGTLALVDDMSVAASFLLPDVLVFYLTLI